MIESHAWRSLRLEFRNAPLGGFHPALPCSAADFDGRPCFESCTFAYVHNWNEICISKDHVIISIKMFSGNQSEHFWFQVTEPELTSHTR